MKTSAMMAAALGCLLSAVSAKEWNQDLASHSPAKTTQAVLVGLVKDPGSVEGSCREGSEDAHNAGSNGRVKIHRGKSPGTPVSGIPVSVGLPVEVGEKNLLHGGTRYLQDRRSDAEDPGLKTQAEGWEALQALLGADRGTSSSDAPGAGVTEMPSISVFPGYGAGPQVPPGTSWGTASPGRTGDSRATFNILELRF